MLKSGAFNGNEIETTDSSILSLSIALRVLLSSCDLDQANPGFVFLMQKRISRLASMKQTWRFYKRCFNVAFKQES